jgi:hypothetical protein
MSELRDRAGFAGEAVTELRINGEDFGQSLVDFTHAARRTNL